MKKKIISCLVAMSLIVSSGSYAFADHRLNGNGETANTRIVKTVHGSYVVTVPEEVTIPSSNQFHGSIFNIGYGESILGPREYLKVRVVENDDNNFDLDNSGVSLRNGESTIFSPLRLTQAADGASIHPGNENDVPDNQKLYELTADDTNGPGNIVAYFGPTANNRAAGVGLTAAGYKLFAYRAYTDETLQNVAGDQVGELEVGDYTGTITFQLEVEEDGENPEAPNAEGWNDTYDNAP